MTKRSKTNTPNLWKVETSRRFPKGSWLVRYRDADNRTQQKSFARRQDALDHLATVRTDIRRGDYVSPRKAQTPLAEVAEKWFAAEERRWKPKTRHGYRIILDRILKELGGYPVSRIDASRIREFLGKQGKSVGTQRNILWVLSPIMNMAIDDGLTQANPCTRVAKKLKATGTREEMRFLNATQVAQIADEVGSEYSTYVFMAGYTGMRAGEIVALRVKHLDLIRKRVTVQESTAVVSGELHTSVPKTKKSRRTIGLPSFLVELLMQQTAGKGPDDFVFTGARGAQLRHDHFYQRVFEPARDDLIKRGDWPKSLDGLRFHDLRHTAVSILIHLGAHAKQISEWMGHSSIAITMDRYGHLFEGHDSEILEGLDKLHREAPKPVAGEVVALRQG